MTLRRPRTLRVAVRVAVALVALAVIATAAVAATASHGTTYRTAVATRSTVTEELQLTGTIQPVVQATVAFPIAGTVAAVAVKVGQTIATGQTLATLDPSTLQADLTGKEADLAAAQLTLEKAENGESTGGAGGSSPQGLSPQGSSPQGSSPQGTTSTPTAASSATTSAATTASPTATGAKSSGSTSAAAILAARQAVSRDEGRVKTALAAAQGAIHAATTACASNQTPPSTTSTTSSTTALAADPDPQACATAQATALRSLQSLATAQQTLAKDQSALSQLLASTSSASATPTGATTPTTSAADRTPTTVTYTAKQLAAYEAAVAAAAAEVAAAQQALAQATIVSPINGTIAAVDLATGATVTAASSTANVVVVSNGGYEVATTVSVAQRAKVKVGDKATVVADGSGPRLAAKVVAIGAASTSDGTTTYPVVLGFTETPSGLRNGASASLKIEVARAVDAVSVPTSAVQTVGTLHTVTVITAGKPTTVRVQLGTIGAERTSSLQVSRPVRSSRWQISARRSRRQGRTRACSATGSRATGSEALAPSGARRDSAAESVVVRRDRRARAHHVAVAVGIVDAAHRRPVLVGP